MKSKLILTVMTLLLAAGLSSAAYADTVDFTLTQATGSVSRQAGGTITYNATISAPLTNGAPIFLSGDSATISSPLSMDDTDLFLDFPASLNPGDSYTDDLFTITVPAGTAAGVYLSSFTLQGGVDGSDQSTLGTVSFSTTVTPEPSSLLLFGTGLGTLMGGIRRKLR